MRMKVNFSDCSLSVYPIGQTITSIKYFQQIQLFTQIKYDLHIKAPKKSKKNTHKYYSIWQCKKSYNSSRKRSVWEVYEIRFTRTRRNTYFIWIEKLKITSMKALKCSSSDKWRGNFYYLTKKVQGAVRLLPLPLRVTAATCSGGLSTSLALSLSVQYSRPCHIKGNVYYVRIPLKMY